MIWKVSLTQNRQTRDSNKSLLLVDDICDSGATLKEIGKLLTACGAQRITPLVIAKTVGGDLDNG